MKNVILILLLFFSAYTYAGTQTGTVGSVIVRASDGLVYFTLENGSLDNRPSCATKGYWMIKDENSNAGKQQYSMILAAHASRKVVKVVGMNTCSRWADGEDVNYIQILNQ